MKRSTSLLFFALLACAPAAPHPAVAPAPAPPAALAATGTARRVVLLSFDGLGADALARQTGLAAFDQLARDGASARVVPVSPTATIPGHVAILTGANPQKTGIVSNRFHLPGTPPEQETYAKDVDPDVESIVEVARRQGKRVGAVPFPTIDGTTPRRMADFGLGWSDPIVRGRVITLKREDFKQEWVPPTWTPRPQRHASYSPVRRARLEWSVPQQTRIDVDVVAYDRTDDQLENYDAIYLESGDFEASPDAQGWFPISLRVGEALDGSWSKVLSVDPALAEVKIYWGPISRSEAWPASFAALLEQEVGFWPGAPDEKVDPQTFTEQSNRLTEFFSRAQTLAMQRMQFDLLLLYQPVIDQAAHPYLGRNETVMREAFLAADRALNEVARRIDPARDALIVTGDHGLVVPEREIRMNALLAGTGFRAFAAGLVAHLYGTGDADAVVNMLTATGYFERIEKKTAASHRNTGDIVVYAYPSNALSSSSQMPVIGPQNGRGQHGALNTHRELHTVLFATGVGTPKGPLGEIQQTKIARFVAALLGIPPPASAE